MRKYLEGSLETLKDLVSYYTVFDTPTKDAPFGTANKQCLEKVLEIARKMGFETKNVDNFAGHIEFKGQTDEIVGVLAHIDVVPIGTGWKHDPLKCEIENGFMFGRGVHDNKGCVVACLYAMKELKDEGFTPTKTIRLIVGCDEERGSSCVQHYFQKEKMPSIGFSPDGHFPATYCEKGILWLELETKNTFKHFSNISGGNKTNMVAGEAEAIYFGEKNVEFFLQKGFKATQIDKNKIKVIALGESGHGSRPWKFDNAIWKLMALVNEIENNEVSNYIYNCFCKDCFGKSSGIYFEDEESGKLSENLGTILQTENKIVFSIDLRYPISTTKNQILEKLQQNAIENTKISVINEQEYLYVSKNSELIQTLMKVYRKHTKSNSEPLCVGGGTYAREMKNAVAFGPIFEDEESTAHMQDECISLKNYEKFYEIYKDAIKELSK